MGIFKNVPASLLNLKDFLFLLVSVAYILVCLPSRAYKYSEHSDIECWLNISRRVEEGDFFNFETNIYLQTNIEGTFMIFDNIFTPK